MDFFDSAELPWSCRQLFDLIADIERYPEFLPYWSEVRILESGGNSLYVQQRLDAGPVPVRFRTRVAFEPERRIRIITEDGPLRGMEIEWRFEPAGENRCRVGLRVHREPVRGLLRGPLEALLTRSSRELLPLFRRRARDLYAWDSGP
jgi:coenzyme Q-binding protein COQ10